MGRLLLVRHAQSAWNAAGRWQGWADVPLSELGLQQAEQAGRALAVQGVVPADICCSDLSRARTTATLIAGELGYRRDLVVDAGLREHDVGSWNGLSTDEIDARWPGQVRALRSNRLAAFPEGEGLRDFNERCRQAVLRLAALALGAVKGADHTGAGPGAGGPGGDVVAVSHGGVIAAVEHWLGVWSPERRHPNLAGWWLGVSGTPGDPKVEAVTMVRLLSMGSQTVTDVA